MISPDTFGILPSFFITICCRVRGRNQLPNDELWAFMEESVIRINEEGARNCSLFVAMPGHILGIVQFGSGSMKAAIAQWKRWIAGQSESILRAVIIFYELTII
ncbi:MAG: hypothetical protein R3F11_18180 [Verrucomicrobiales bacterium]